MLGDKVTMQQSLFITIFSMTIVFLSLLIIFYLIQGFQKLSNKNRKEKSMKSTNLIKTKEKSEENEDEEELVAVLAAAIAASRGIDISNVKINSIKRIPQDTPIWAKVGRQEQIFNKL